MCGIAGIFRPGGLPSDAGTALVAMRDALAHRGPDGRGEWSDPAQGIALAHARLAVLDLSPRGAQPMSDPTGRAVLSYNGEVYNFGELRRELSAGGVIFAGSSDTEVVLQACLAWGVDRALPRFNGMFAFALWVASERALYLVRDRMGVKPLYFSRSGGTTLFGSELSALRAHPGFSPALDEEALSRYLMLRYVPAPATIYRAARKLLPGHYLRITAKGEELVRWYDGGEPASPGRPTLAEAGEELEGLLADSVRLRLVSDVPLGVFLSGGVDSSLIAALMARAGGKSPSTFTVGFSERAFDESGRAAAVARALGADHHLLVVKPGDLPAHLPSLASLYDDPLSDPSALPLALLSSFARKKVTVLLSGDGADETMGGYDRYRFFLGRGGRIVSLPRPLRRALAGLLSRFSPGLIGALYPAFAGRGRVENFPLKWGKAVNLLRQEGMGEAYLSSVGVFSRAEAAALLGRAVTLPPGFAALAGAGGGAGAMMRLDQETFLPDDVLTKVDRAGMSRGLEVRDPFLDHRLVEWGRRLPSRLHFADGRGKAPLREVARRVVPACGPDRPKMGFALPLGEWFRGPLRGLLEERLGEGRIRGGGLFDPRAVSRLVAEHGAGRADHSERLWNLLFFEMWRERWRPTLG